MNKAFDTVRFIVGPTILLHSGEYFDFVEPHKSAFTIDDIAHGLSNVCRFAGQSERFYSVAEHSIYVSQIVPPRDALAALMHDAAEAFIGDVSKPLKGLLPEYKAIEDRVEAAIFERFNIPLPLPKSVKWADITMLATEKFHVMRNHDDWDYTAGRKMIDMNIECWLPSVAKHQFLCRFNELVSLGDRSAHHGG
jgi:hypothetical protein